MANFGALIDNNNGNPFVTPNSTPFVLYAKVSANSVDAGADYKTANGSVDIPANYPAMVFMRSNNRCVLAASRSGNRIVFSGSIQGRNNPHFTVTAYIFARFPQPLPRWGFAIWDASGTCILTNESKVLTDLVTVGSFGNNGGINIDQTLPGKYAVSPMLMGATLIQIFVQGQPQIIQISAGAGAYDNGSGTRINAVATQAGAGSVAGYQNTGVALTAINVDGI